MISTYQKSKLRPTAHELNILTDYCLTWCFLSDHVVKNITKY